MNTEITFSAGVAEWTPGDESTSHDALIARADAATYRAKKAGRERTCLAGDEMPGHEPA